MAGSHVIRSAQVSAELIGPPTGSATAIPRRDSTSGGCRGHDPDRELSVLNPRFVGG